MLFSCGFSYNRCVMLSVQASYQISVSTAYSAPCICASYNFQEDMKTVTSKQPNKVGHKSIHYRLWLRSGTHMRSSGNVCPHAHDRSQLRDVLRTQKG